ncbi:MAG: 2,3,4,5-tetrahydropyridine-2,6-dicarboxylate N-succinyltransferase [Pseudomonadota bacterium]
MTAEANDATFDPAALQGAIEEAWERRTEITTDEVGPARDAVEAALDALDRGVARVAEPEGETSSGLTRWRVNEWLKKAVLLSFRLNPMGVIEGGPGGAVWWDTAPSKFLGWGAAEFDAAGFRAVPSAVVRRSAHIAPSVVLMPCFVNLGARVGANSMIDTWATVGSCAQVGENCHISGGAGIGGVLEPLQAAPVIIEDNVFVGARSEVAEGVIVREGAVLSMGVFIGASTKIVDRDTGQVMRGEVPPYSVVVPGVLPSEGGGPSLACAVIVKRVDAQTRAKTSVNELLRD